MALDMNNSIYNYLLARLRENGAARRWLRWRSASVISVQRWGRTHHPKPNDVVAVVGIVGGSGGPRARSPEGRARTHRAPPGGHLAPAASRPNGSTRTFQQLPEFRTGPDTTPRQCPPCPESPPGRPLPDTSPRPLSGQDRFRRCWPARAPAAGPSPGPRDRFSRRRRRWRRSCHSYSVGSRTSQPKRTLSQWQKAMASHQLTVSAG